jgi:PEP-CTERM motif
LTPHHQNAGSNGAGSFDKKLAAYALAGGAALFSAGTADAALVIVDPVVNPTVSVAEGVDGFSIDMDDDGVEDFVFAAAAAQLEEPGDLFGFVFAGGYGPDRLIGGFYEEYDSYPLPVATNFPNVAAALAANPTLTKAKLLARYRYAGEGIDQTFGEWPNSLDASGLLGVSFLLNDVTPTAGFIDVSVEIASATVTVNRWGYDVQDAVIPEPSTMALFALGAAGVAALRRRKVQ